MAKKLLVLLGIVGNAFFGKRGEGMWFGWTGHNDPTKPSTWSWIYPFKDWNVEHGVQLTFPLLGSFCVFIHKETGKVHTNFKGFNPKTMRVDQHSGEDRVFIQVTDSLTVRVHIDQTTKNFMVYIEHGPDKLLFALTSDSQLLRRS